jgi:hypothetical protein
MEGKQYLGIFNSHREGSRPFLVIFLKSGNFAQILDSIYKISGGEGDKHYYWWSHSTYYSREELTALLKARFTDFEPDLIDGVYWSQST